MVALPHVVRAISDCLDYKFWTLPRACEANRLSLLPRLVAWGASDGVDPHYWRYQCGKGLVFAVKHDNLAMVEWLHGHCPSILPYNAMIEAARTGNVRMLEWLYERHENAPLTPQLMASAVVRGQLETLKWLYDQPRKYGCSSNAMLAAIEKSHYDTVVWIHEHVGGFLFKKPLRVMWGGEGRSRAATCAWRCFYFIMMGMTCA